jgi:predicted deacylase
MSKKASLYTNKKKKNNKKKFLLLGSLFLLISGIILIGNNLGTQSNTISSNETYNNYKIIVINNNTGANIINNTLLMQNIPKTELSIEMILAAKNGTPMIIFGDGSEPHVMIVAGTHGAELPSQIAAMKLINNLTTKKIKGTIYIIPFAIPYNTANNIRFNNGTDPNRVAQILGTPTNIIANTAKKYNVTFFGDFHSTQPNDIPGKNCIIYYPKNQKSVELANYLQNKTGSPLTEVEPYPGVMTTVTNNTGITSVTCEVLSPHGTMKPGSSELSYQYMIGFLRYTGIFQSY